MASPAEVVRAVLVEAGLVIMPDASFTYPPGDERVPCFVKSMPDSPDTALLLTDLAGRTFGSNLKTGDFHSHPGVKLTSRAPVDTDGYDLLKTIATFLKSRRQSDGGRQSVPIRGNECYIQSIYQTMDIIPLDDDESRRPRWTFNVQVSMQDTAELPLE